MKLKQIIKGDYNNLSISSDVMQHFVDKKGKLFKEKEELLVTFLFTPTMHDTVNHYHIDLNLKEVKKLTKFLNKFLKENT